MEIITQKEERVNQLSTQTDHFFNRLQIGRQLSGLRFRKIHGERPLILIKLLIQIVWTGKNWFRLGRDGESSYKKDVVYRFLNNQEYNWEGLLSYISSSLVRIFTKLTRKRVKAVIVDDTFFDRSRSKKVEGLSRIHDHTDGKYKKGFSKLLIGWCDGFSFVPLMFRLLSSSKEKNCLCPMEEAKEGSKGKSRREQAKMKKTDALIEILNQVKKLRISFHYVLMDSWFSFPAVINRITNLGMNCICMLKRMPRVYYELDGNKYNLKELHLKFGKKIKPSSPFSLTVKMTGGKKANIIFIMDRRNSKNWLALLSTDLEIDGEEVVRIYGYRWDIEVCFKICKSYLKLAKEFQGRSYDMIVAHTTIVLIRYCMLALALRENNDEKTIGDLFYQYADEVRQRSFFEAIQMLLVLLVDFLADKFILKRNMVQQALDEFISAIAIPAFKPCFKVCES